MKYVNDIFDRIKNSAIFVMIQNFLRSIFGKKTEEGEPVSNPMDDTIKTHNTGAVDSSRLSYRIADKFVKSLKKKFKKFATNDKFATTKIAKIIDMIIRGACIIAGVIFAALVIYTIIKILPQVLLFVAMCFATVICIELIMSIIGKACGCQI